MLNAKAYDNYFGGKSGNGTYQTIINNIPPHREFYSLFLGNCGITRHIKPAAFNFLNDIDPEVIKAWQKVYLPQGNGCSYTLNCGPALEVLKSLAEKCDTAANRFIYLDPPYRFAVRKGKTPVYRFEMTDNQHSDLLSQIIAMDDHNIMISHYPDEMYDEILLSAGWQYHDFYSMIRNGLALERIYMNYQPGDLLHDYNYVGADFREREALDRQRKNFIQKLNQFPARLRNAILQDIQKLY